jgi:hypothetical protein
MYPKCPGCEKTGTIFGQVYGLPIGSHVKGNNDSVHGVILVMCGECGVVVGAYPRSKED